MMGGYDAPEVESTPEKQATKSVTASATAAAQQQRERASRNRGLAASILTTQANSLGSTNSSTASDTLG